MFCVERKVGSKIKVKVISVDVAEQFFRYNLTAGAYTLTDALRMNFELLYVIKHHASWALIGDWMESTIPMKKQGRGEASIKSSIRELFARVVAEQKLAAKDCQRMQNKKLEAIREKFEQVNEKYEDMLRKAAAPARSAMRYPGGGRSEGEYTGANLGTPNSLVKAALKHVEPPSASVGSISNEKVKAEALPRGGIVLPKEWPKPSIQSPGS